MILECPECSARYVVPDTLIGPEGRTVRCAKCAHNWFTPGINVAEVAPAPAVQESEFGIDASARIRSAYRQALTTPRIIHAPLGLKLVTATFFIASAMLYVFLFAPSLYGITSSSGLSLANIDVTKTPHMKYFTYQFKGNVINTTDETRLLDTIRIQLIDQGGAVLQEWPLVKNVPIVASGSLSFETEKLEVPYTKAAYFVVDVGSGTELMLRGGLE